MLNYNNVIKDNKSYNGLTIKEIVSIKKLNIRGKKREFFTNLDKIINIILPTEANTSSVNDRHTSIWLSPDEWIIHSNDSLENNNSYELEELLYTRVSKNNLGSVTDVTDQFVMINMEGKNVFELLSSGCPLNFNEFKKKVGSSAQTVLNHIDVIIHNKKNNNVNLFVRRSFSEHLFSWINDAASRL